MTHFVPNFVAMATRVCLFKISLTSFDSLTSETPLLDEKISEISLTQAEIYPILCQISLPAGHPKVNLNDAVKLPIPENHTIEPKITTLSRVQPEL